LPAGERCDRRGWFREADESKELSRSVPRGAPTPPGGERDVFLRGEVVE